MPAQKSNVCENARKPTDRSVKSTGSNKLAKIELAGKFFVGYPNKAKELCSFCRFIAQAGN
jgi:hypothetical protein